MKCGKTLGNLLVQDPGCRGRFCRRASRPIRRLGLLVGRPETGYDQPMQPALSSGLSHAPFREFQLEKVLTTIRSVMYDLLRIESFLLCERILNPLETAGPSLRVGASSADIAHLVQAGGEAELLPRLTETGDITLVYDEGDGAKGLMWLSPRGFATYNYDWLVAVMAKSDVNTRYLWVAPSHRARGVGRLLNLAADGPCVRAGYSRIVSLVNTLNRPAIGSDAKIGYRILAQITCWRLLSLCRVKTNVGTSFHKATRCKPLVISFDALRERHKKSPDLSDQLP